MGLPGARIGDMHTCPLSDGPKPHVGGPIVFGWPTVLIGSVPASRFGDFATCIGPPDTISRGAITVRIGKKAAARQTDQTAHGGLVVIGFPTVLIGDGHFSQEQSMSCVIASSRNLIALMTDQVPDEATLRNLMRLIMADPSHNFNVNGINPIHAQALLRLYGINTEIRRNQTPAQLAALTNGGGPVLIGFRNPGHRVMLDSVTTDSSGNTVYNVRDPASTYGGQTRQMTPSQFNNRYNQNAITIVPTND
jgi:uncharacterized Zn-binding protein involved in type VI secretion